jgi:ABC-type transport system involved in cytochrome c biogenesis permease subunit
MSLVDPLAGIGLLLAVLGTVAVVMSLLSHWERFRHAVFGLLLASSAVLAALICLRLYRHAGALPPRSVYIETLAWGLTVFSLIVWRRKGMEFMVLILAPFILVIMLAALLAASSPLPSSQVFTLHVLLVFSALTCMALACGAAVIFLVQERSIKGKEPLRAIRLELPALSRLDAINSWCAVIGFPLYTAGLLLGTVAARLTWGSMLSGDPKELISLLIWGLYAFWLHQRMGHGWRGRKPARLAIAVFALTVFSLFIVNTLTITHHSFLAR